MIRLPTVEQCFNILNDNHVPNHIIEHSVMVAKVGYTLTKALNVQGNGLELDLGLVTAACLLHDVKKMECIEANCDHAEVGAHYLALLGHGEIADLVRQHYRLDPKNKDFSTIKEVHLLYYADNRVKHHEIVGVDVRFADLIERYGRDETTIRELKLRLKETKELEDRLFSHLTFGPDTLEEEVKNGESDKIFGPFCLSHRDRHPQAHSHRPMAGQPSGT